MSRSRCALRLAFAATSTLCLTAIPSQSQGSLTWSRDFGNTAFGYALGATSFTTSNGPELFVASYWGSTGQADWVSRWTPALGWRGLGPPYLNDYVEDVIVYDNGTGPCLYACGAFTSPRIGIMRWRPNASWEALSAGGFTDMYLGPTLGFARPNVMNIHDDGTGQGLYVAGQFSAGQSSPSNLVISRNVIRFDGAGWHSLAGGVDDGVVYALASFDDGTGPALYVGGSFTSVGGGQPIPYLARWRGGTWSSVGAFQTNSYVYDLEVFDDGAGPALYAAVTIGPVFLQKWDGVQWAAVQPQPPASLGKMHVYDDGRGDALYCSMGGSAISRSLGRFDGHSWTGLGGGVWNTSALPEVEDFATYDAGNGPDLFLVGGMRFAGGGIASRGVAQWRRLQPGTARLCPGDGTYVPCPCPGFGLPGHGCPNSADNGGADLAWMGQTADDSLAFQASALPANAAAILFQGDVLNTNGQYAPGSSPFFGDGLRCASGHLRRMYQKVAVAGQVTAPEALDPTIRARSAALGDFLAAGSARVYQVWYRDVDPNFCVAPASWNVTNAVRVIW